VLLQLGILALETFAGGGQIFYFRPIILNFAQDGLKLLNLVFGDDRAGSDLSCGSQAVGWLDGWIVGWMCCRVHDLVC
jgi:hypothetical protein